MVEAIHHEIEQGRLRIYTGRTPKLIDSSFDLGSGETEAITLALQLRGVLLTDDADARTDAEARGIPAIGTLGILIDARRRGDIASVHPLLVELRSQGFWLSQRLIEATRRAEAEN
jgi:predicted nucleic acid-binding protein